MEIQSPLFLHSRQSWEESLNSSHLHQGPARLHPAKVSIVIHRNNIDSIGPRTWFLGKAEPIHCTPLNEIRTRQLLCMAEERVLLQIRRREQSRDIWKRPD